MLMASGLATRCAACGTVFRVVPDQLRVSDGWVRCGRCSEVFNAAEALLDLETGAARPAPPSAGVDPGRIDLDLTPQAPPSAPAGVAPAAPPAGREPVQRAPPGAAAPSPGPWARPPAAEPAVAPAPAAPLVAVAASPPLPLPALAPAPAPAATQEPDLFEATAAFEHSLPIVDDSASRFGPDALLEGPEPRDLPPPSFVRRAERAARWRRPRVRWALGAGCLLAALALAAQALWVWRDLAAARMPAARPALVQACDWLGCSIGPPHVIDALAVESSGLVRVEKSNLYRLNVALRNRESMAVAVPALELALTDSQGKLLARRVLRAAELGVAQTTVAAGGDIQLQATLQAVPQTGNEPVAGYTIELFYP